MTAEEMMEALADNFLDYPAARKMMLEAPKYGVDHEAADASFVELQDFFNETAKAQADRVGLKSYLPVYINNAQNTTLARWVGATPNGRKSGCATANANNPESVEKHKILKRINKI